MAVKGINCVEEKEEGSTVEGKAWIYSQVVGVCWSGEGGWTAKDVVLAAIAERFFHSSVLYGYHRIEQPELIRG